MTVSKFLFCLLFLSFFSPSLSLTSHSVSEATRALWDSFLVGMSLIFEYGGERVTPNQLKFITVFAPSDVVFERNGQPSLSHLHLHFVPLRLSLKTLKSQRYGRKIPTLNPNRFLLVTSSPSDYNLSINGVEIDYGSRIYDDGSLLIFEVKQFFDSDFKAPSPFYGNPPCTAPSNRGFVDSRDGYLFRAASVALKLNRYTVMASFLDMQIGRVGAETLLTVFAPRDDEIKDYLGDFDDCPSLFLSHFVPCKITGRELYNFANGILLPTYLEGFKINATRDGDQLRINGVSIVDRSIFTSNWLIVHGIGGVLAQMEKSGARAASESKSGGNSLKFGGEWIETVILVFSMISIFLELFSG